MYPATLLPCTLKPCYHVPWNSATVYPETLLPIYLYTILLLFHYTNLTGFTGSNFSFVFLVINCPNVSLSISCISLFIARNESSPRYLQRGKWFVKSNFYFPLRLKFMRFNLDAFSQDKKEFPLGQIMPFKTFFELLFSPLHSTF